MINLEEILMVNLTGVVILVVLMLLRVENRAAKHLGDYLFDTMEYLTLFALAAETFSTFTSSKSPFTLSAICKSGNTSRNDFIASP